MSINFLESAVFHCLIKESSFCQILFIFQKKKNQNSRFAKNKNKTNKKQNSAERGGIVCLCMGHDSLLQLAFYLCRGWAYRTGYRTWKWKQKMKCKLRLSTYQSHLIFFQMWACWTCILFSAKSFVLGIKILNTVNTATDKEHSDHCKSITLLAIVKSHLCHWRDQSAKVYDVCASKFLNVHNSNTTHSWGRGGGWGGGRADGRRWGST